MKTGIGWNHPIDESDQWDGFNDPGIEQFRGDPIRHLAREVIQNAIDAAVPGAPVEVKFKLHEVDASTIPNLYELKEIYTCCLEASEHESPKARYFFDNALKELKKNKIFVLEISDYNTQGMKGPCVNGRPFYAFMKAKGQSKKSSETAAGSYGIGKFAPYAVSKLRVIYISTIYQGEDGQWTQLSQGKSILMSYDQDGKRRQGTGFWGVRDKCQPIIGISSDLPSWILRTAKKEEYSKNSGSCQ